MDIDKELHALIEEHKELVNLYIHQDTLAWHLVYIYFFIVGTLASAIVISMSSFTANNSKQEIGFYMSLLSFFGMFISILWFFMFCRSKIYREVPINAALMIEKEITKRLEDEKLAFNTLGMTVEAIRNKKFLKPNGRFRKIRILERFPSLKTVHYIFFVLAIIWLMAGIYFLFRN